MLKKLHSTFQPILKSLLLLALVCGLVLTQADFALAARSGGRIGGGSFRAPTRTYAPSPSRGPGGGYYGGGGFGFPFLIPFFGFGGGFGGLFSIFIVIAIANFLVNTFRSVTSETESGVNTSTVSVARVQVGLLASGRSLQTDLDRMAETADTGSASGRAQVLQEATLAILRHPEYWAYGSTQVQQTGLNSAEAQFNQWTLAERSKFTEETLSNVNNDLSGGSTGAPKLSGSTTGELVKTTETENPGEYIIVTLVVGAFGQLKFPKVNSSEDLRQVVSQLGSISSEQLLAVEILWTPQASGDTLSTDDLLAYYPNLTLV
ncbi:MAG: DUF1517 domain-containing protein [Microcoleaceae cyanobacterium]